ncbi:type IV toxin-antitoxin system AbiEi family antitoxin domain-containing protein [Salsipaludibacter albus]|uniref:type IV toxin-antitoxin system AbiEi family antitoxin domain-containing protein n=1 Tax=Salsipaludibacter albus TaxID=2849650 RepID=UPI001EE4B224|nr:type IV toxin-antitoxin system AbiEi family antitoxin domain-containing protein [Salsipaludibacter albus]MBY5164094.1 hypothetical protein [Salsipaludibacter albus]
MSHDHGLASICRRQFGVFSHAQARTCGIADSTIVRRVGRGRYARLFPGVFMDRAVPETWEARAMAAQLSVGGDAVLARTTAARIHDLDLPTGIGDRALHLLSHVRSFPTSPGLVVHRSKSFDDSDVTRIGPFTLTTVTRTVLDVAADLDPSLLRRILSEGVRRQLTDATALRATARRLGPVAGRRVVLDMADELSPLDAACRSPLETEFLHLVSAAGLPPTAMNHPVVDGAGRRRVVDAVYLPERVPIELDSRRWHHGRLDRNDDERRERAIVAAGWREFLHFTSTDLREGPRLVVDEVRRELESARGTPLPTRTSPVANIGDG